MLKLSKEIPPTFFNCFSILGPMPLHINIRICLFMCVKIHDLIWTEVALYLYQIGRIDAFTLLSLPIHELGTSFLLFRYWGSMCTH